MDQSEIVVSIICLTYNHEKYIRECLNGFVSQKTDFRYEIIIHDDASLDQTAAIIREYECKYPEIIKAVYQTQNQHSRHVPIVKTFLLPHIRGRYIALCEGDDYWTDPHKLQKQVDGMWQHPSCSMCTHKVVEVYEDGTPNGNTYPSTPQQTGVFSSRQFFEIGKQYSFHTSSYFIKTEHYVEYRLNPPEFVKKCDVGDEVMMLFFGMLGDVFYIADEMSCYRRGVSASWTARNFKNFDRMISHGKKMVDTLQSFDKYTQEKYHLIMRDRIALQMSKTVILEMNAQLFLKKENWPYFCCLSIKRKVFIVLSMIFPRIMRKVYMHRIEKLTSGRGV